MKSQADSRTSKAEEILFKPIRAKGDESASAILLRERGEN
jgi:hypothetical protein